MALSTIPTRALSEQGINFRNLIINGDMSIAQRGTSFTGQTSGAYYNDRFKTGISGLGTWTISQVTDAPTGQGLVKSQKFDCTTADASPSAGDFLTYLQPIEGQNLQMLKKGTSSAESLTLSFWVKSNKTGTYISRLYDVDNQRVISKSYTISSASTWEKKTLTFAGDTSGTLDNDNGFSFAVEWCLGAGTNYTSGTLNTSWNSKTDADQFVGQVNLADSTSNEWYITGVQLEVGTTASDFEFLPYDVNLTRCMRYFERVSKDGNRSYGPIANGMQRTTTQAYGHVMCRVLKRSSANSVSQSNIIVTDRKTTDADVTAIGNISTDYQGVHMDFTHSSFGADFRPVFITGDNATGGYVDIDSEL